MSESEVFLNQVSEHQRKAEIAEFQYQEAMTDITQNISALGDLEAIHELRTLHPGIETLDVDNPEEARLKNVSETQLLDAITKAVKARKNMAVHNFEVEFTRENLIDNILDF